MRNNKFLKTFAIITPVLLIGVMIYLFLNFQNKKKKVDALTSFPTFSLTTIEGKSFTRHNLVDHQSKVIVYFSSTCHFCHAEAEELYKNYKDYQNIQWIWISSESLNEIKKFAQKHHLNEYNNIYWCHDNMATLYKNLAMNSIPYFLVYDKKNHLIRRNSGAIKLEKLISNTDEGK